MTADAVLAGLAVVLLVLTLVAYLVDVVLDGLRWEAPDDQEAGEDRPPPDDLGPER